MGCEVIVLGPETRYPKSLSEHGPIDEEDMESLIRMSYLLEKSRQDDLREPSPEGRGFHSPLISSAPSGPCLSCLTSNTWSVAKKNSLQEFLSPAEKKIRNNFVQ